MPQQRTGEGHGVANGKLSVLRKHPIFADLEPEAFDQLCRYAKHSMLKRGATLFSKGDPGNSLYAVISGTVKMSISSPDGRNAILNIIGPGEIFGEIALLDGRERSADAIANSNCELFVIDRREFIPFVKGQPTLAMKFIELLCERLRWTSDQVEQIILQNLPGRLASALLRLSEKQKSAPQGRTIAITQQEISEMVGMTRESINKQLRAWAAREWVRLEHGAIVVLNAEMLRELAEAGSDRRRVVPSTGEEGSDRELVGRAAFAASSDPHPSTARGTRPEVAAAVQFRRGPGVTSMIGQSTPMETPIWMPDASLSGGFCW